MAGTGNERALLALALPATPPSAATDNLNAMAKEHGLREEEVVDHVLRAYFLTLRWDDMEEISLCLDGCSGLMHRLGHASLVGVLTDEPMRKFGQRHLKFCQTIYLFKDVFYSTVKEGGEE
jgi:hypothetical protein